MKPNLWKNWSISARLIFITIIPVALLFCSDVLYTYLFRHAEVQEELAERGRIVASALAESSEYGVISGNLADLERIAKGLVQADNSIYEINIQKSDRSVVLHVASNVPQAKESQVFEAPVKRRLLAINEFEDEGLPHLSGQENIKQASGDELAGYVRVTMSPSVLVAKQTHRIYVQSAMSLLALFASVLCALYLARALHKPMATTIHALRKIRGGDYAVHVDVSAGGEIGELLSSINEMSVSLEESKRDLENKVLARTRDLEESRNAALKSNAEKRKLIQKVNSIVEDERKSIAIEIHDELNAVLIGARLNSRRILDLTANAEPGSANAEIRASAESILKVCADLYASARKIVRRLRPEVLDLLGLQGAVEEMLHSYDISHPDCKFEFQSRGDFSGIGGDRAIAGYRLIQESLSNVIKHARASRVCVSLFADDESNSLHITIADNGLGFDLEAASAGIGIIGMRERVCALNGQMKIVTAMGCGATIEIQLPL